MKSKYLTVVSTVALAVYAVPAAAQSERQEQGDESGSSEGFGVIVVTADKRPTAVQDIPLAISAFGEKFIEENGVKDIGDLVAFTPGLSGANYEDTESVFTIRGIGTSAFGVGADTSVGVFVDDIYQGRTVNAGNSFFDVERVEVVKGPQGTLFGRNTAAGAISIITNKPDLSESFIKGSIGLGERGYQNYELIANGAVSDTFGVRLAVKYDLLDGPYRNTTDGQELNNRDHLNARLSFTSEWSPTVRTSFSAEYFSADSHAGAITLAGTPDADLAAIPDTVTQNVSRSQDIETWKLTLRNDFDLTDDITLSSITGFIDTDLVAVPIDVDTTAAPILYLSEPQKIEQFSQELRLVGTTGSIDWLLGASVTLEDIQGTATYDFSDDAILLALVGADCATLGVPAALCNLNAREEGFASSDNTSFGIYSDVKFHLSSELTLSVGARYSYDRKEFVHQANPTDSATTALVLGRNLFKPVTGGPLTETKSWDEFTYRIALDYQPTSDLLLYASYATGYKAGGFNSIGDFTNPAKPRLSSFDPEQNSAIEFGAKIDFLDRRARVNLAVYRNDFDDYQIETTTDGLQVFIQNAARLRTQGLEIDARFQLADFLEVYGNYSYLNAEFKNGQAFNGLTGALENLNGNRLPRAPENTFSIGALATADVGELGEFSFRANYAYESSHFFDPFKSVALSQDGYGVLSLRAGLEDYSESWSVAVVADNVTNERFFTTKAIGLTPIGIPNLGRVVRGEVSFRF